MVHGIEKGQKLYKEERIIRPDVQVNKILRNTSIWSIFYVAGLCLGLDLKYSCAPWVQYWIRNHETWNDLFLNDLILVETRFDILHLFYLLSIMIWVCLKSGKAWCCEMIDLSDQYFWFIVADILLLPVNEVFLDLNVKLNA